jgi:pimeloyl-ACP methyl ester carboxylesterase
MAIIEANPSMDRRTAIGAVAGTSFGAILDGSVVARVLGVSRTGIKAPSQRTSIVLVHGAWADGSNWETIIPQLERRGFSVISAQIALTTLSDDIATVQRTLERTTGPVVLVGHAYSGAVVGSIHDERVRSIVYIAALAPAEGETVADVFYKDPKPPLSPKLGPDAHGFIWMPEGGVQNALAQNASVDQARIMAAVQRPIAIQCIKEKAPAPAWPAKPTWYLVAEEDRMINPVTERFMASRMGAKIRSLRVDHSPQVTAPTHVIDLIVEAAS